MLQQEVKFGVVDLVETLAGTEQTEPCPEVEAFTPVAEALVRRLQAVSITKLETVEVEKASLLANSLSKGD